ncbi:PTS system mannose/fructose/sorbose family transporter subunit IID [Companilactobacillus hulinensis]|uniref:PTS system mannose/fructose/sorbose family transporter subunit IID n=1 Tax=Companilactobacillus hulinensis TaxID=2486007 RepID=UPI000F77FDB9|nr:PTS system mannose/fructose/sorbose family transporter subunit IID [Companilactobacillus hulinensis]
MDTEIKSDKKKLNKKYWQFFWRSWAIQGSWNYERQMNLGFLYGIAPTLDRIYKDPKDIDKKKEAYKRHLSFYNCTPQTSAFVLGLSSSMEEQYAKDPDNFDPESISAVKSSLMGPLSGIGDSFFQGTIKVLAFGLGINFARQGNILGPVLALLISFIPAYLVTWYGAKWGYTAGNQFLSKLNSEGAMDRVMYIAGIVGLIVIGSMVASMITLTTPIHMGGTFKLQSTLDDILPKLIPVIMTMFMYWLIEKKVKTGWILAICIVGGILASVLGILKA